MSNYRNNQKSGISNGHGFEQESSKTMNNSPNELIDFQKLVSLIQRKKWAIITFLICSVAITFYLVNYYFDPIYRSQATVLISSTESQLPASDSGIGKIVSNSFDLQAGGQATQSALYLFKSRELASKLAKEILDLNKQSDDISYAIAWSDYPDDSSLISTDALTNRIRGGLTIEPIEPGSNLLAISFESYYPKEASRIVNLAVNSFQELSLEKKRQSAESALTFLREKKGGLKSDLQNAEENQNQYMNKNNLVELESQTQNKVNSLSNLETEQQNISVKLQATSAAINNYQKQIESIKPGLADKFSKAISPTIASYQKRLGDLRTQRFVLISNNPQLKENPDSEPVIRNLNKQIEDLQNEIQRLSKDMLGNDANYSDMSGSDAGSSTQEIAKYQNKLTELRIQKNQYQTQLDALKKSIGQSKVFLKGVPENKIQLARRERQVEMYKELYTTISQQETEVALWKQTQSSIAKIYDYATPNYNPVKPQKLLWLGASILLGLLIPIGFVSAKEHFSSLIDSSEQLKKYPYPLLSVIYDFSLLKNGGWLTKKFGNGNTERISKDIIMYYNSNSPIAESYRRMAGNLLFSQNFDPPQTILVTSSGLGEGKSTLVGNLGWALSELDKNVVIVDCDLRRPRSNKLFNISQKPGITDVINDEIKLSEAIRSTDNSNLFLLPAGEDPINPAQLLKTGKFSDLIKTLESRYDLVLIDTPPYGIVSDIDRLNTLSDYTIVVAKFQGTKEIVLERTLKELDANMQNKNMGIVLNRYIPKDSSDTYETRGMYEYKYQGYNEYQRTSKTNS